MDKDKKLEEFFKKRVNDFDSPSDDWDKPDASVFQNAQMHFPKHPKLVERDWESIVMVLMALLLLSLMGGLFFMKKNMTALENKLQIAETTFQNLDIEAKNNNILHVNTQLAEVEKKCAEGRTELLTQSQITSQTIETLTRQNQEFRKSIVSQNNRIAFLLVENQMLTKGLTSSQAVNLKKSDKDKIEGLTKSQTLIGQLPSRTIPFFPKRKKTFYLRRDVGTDPLDLLPPKSRNKNFEIGLNITSIAYDFPTAYEFEKFEIFEEDEKASISNRMNGMTFNLGYALRPNLWINTGFRKTGGKIEENFWTGLKYDKDGEYIDNDGKTINEFELNTQSNFSDAGNQIDFEVPNGIEISDEDKVYAKWEESQEVQFIHIPFGVTYFSSFSRGSQLEWFLKGGIGWNQITFGDNYFDAEIYFDEKLLPIKKIDSIKESDKKTQYFNGYAGLGLNYQFTRNWNLRTSYTLERNFIKTKKDFANTVLDKVLQVGLNYRF